MTSTTITTILMASIKIRPVMKMTTLRKRSLRMTWIKMTMIIMVIVLVVVGPLVWLLSLYDPIFLIEKILSGKVSSLIGSITGLFFDIMFWKSSLL